MFAVSVADNTVWHNRRLEIMFVDCHRTTANGESASLMYSLIVIMLQISAVFLKLSILYEGWSFNSGNYLFTTDTK